MKDKFAQFLGKKKISLEEFLESNRERERDDQEIVDFAKTIKADDLLVELKKYEQERLAEGVDYINRGKNISLILKICEFFTPKLPSSRLRIRRESEIEKLTPQLTEIANYVVSFHKIMDSISETEQKIEFRKKIDELSAIPIAVSYDSAENISKDLEAIFISEFKFPKRTDQSQQYTREFEIRSEGEQHISSPVLPVNCGAWYDFVERVARDGTPGAFRALRKSGYFRTMPDSHEDKLTHIAKLRQLLRPVIMSGISDDYQFAQVMGIYELLSTYYQETLGSYKPLEDNNLPVASFSSVANVDSFVENFKSEIEKGPNADDKMLEEMIFVKTNKRISLRPVFIGALKGRRLDGIFEMALDKLCSFQVISFLVAHGIVPKLSINELIDEYYPKYLKQYDPYLGHNNNFPKAIDFLNSLSGLAFQSGDPEASEGIAKLRSLVPELRKKSEKFYIEKKPEYERKIQELLASFQSVDDAKPESLYRGLIFAVQEILKARVDCTSRLVDGGEAFVSKNHPLIMNMLHYAVQQSDIFYVKELVGIGCVNYDMVDTPDKARTREDGRPDETVNPIEYLSAMSKIITVADSKVKAGELNGNNVEILKIVVLALEDDLKNNRFLTKNKSKFLPAATQQINELTTELQDKIEKAKEKLPSQTLSERSSPKSEDDLLPKTSPGKVGAKRPILSTQSEYDKYR